jgi:3-phenylpropionate/cinnamic acid dioxygenase small subunit
MMDEGEIRVRAELRALVEEYAVITDALDYDAWLDLFVPDGEFSPTNAGEKEPFIVWAGERLKEVLHNNDQWERTFHMIGNHRVTFEDPQRPQGVTYCLAHHKYRDQPKAYVMLMRYFDDYVETDAGWRFAARRPEMVWNQIVDVDATPLAVAESGQVEL